MRSGGIRERECLACGARRPLTAANLRSSDECPGCGYVGWTDPDSLTSAEREALHSAHRRRRPLTAYPLRR
jgi:hypothetical protein